MSAYSVTLIDCDLCGAVFDAGPQAVREKRSVVRGYARSEGWRSWRTVDLCPTHDELTMPQALDAVDARFAQEPAVQDQTNEQEQSHG